MNKFITFIVLVTVWSNIFSQNMCIENISNGPNNKLKIRKSTHITKEDNIIWSEDFDRTKWKSTVKKDDKGYILDEDATLPQGWNIIDNNNVGYYWHWSDVGPRGSLLNETGECGNPRSDWLKYLPEGTTTDNGFMILESNWYNTTENCDVARNEIDMDSYVEFGPIDFSNEGGAIFNIKMYYIYCCKYNASLNMEISTNYNPILQTGDWNDTIRLNLAAPNDWPSLEQSDLSINISNKVKGYSSVFFRIHVEHSAHYFWIFDDVSFTKPPSNDIVITDSWFDYIFNAEEPEYSIDIKDSYNFWGGYTQIPQPIVGSFVQFRTSIFNNGENDAINTKLTATIFKDGVEQEKEMSDVKEILSYKYDTLKIPTSYIPSDIGHYQVSFTVNMDSEDAYIKDNEYSYKFEVTDKEVYSRVRHGKENEYISASPSDWVGGGEDKDVCAQRFNIPNEVSLKGVQVFIDDYNGRPEEIEAIENGEFSMVARLYAVSNGEIVDLGIASNKTMLQSSDKGAWVYMPFVKGTLKIPKGLYWAGIEIYTGSTDYRFQIGVDDYAPKQPLNGGLCYFKPEGYSTKKWSSAGKNYAIDLAIDLGRDYDITFNVNMSNYSDFNPLTETVSVIGSFGSTVEMTTVDNIHYTATVTSVKSNTYIYKYQTTNNVESFERGITMGVMDISTHDNYGSLIGVRSNKQDKVLVYPNPFNDKLIINNIKGNSNIMVANLFGQVLISEVTKNNNIEINTNYLKQGVYLVTIIDDNGNIKTYKIIKN